MKVQLKKVKAAGFSLVELLVVIAVIGIMAAIAIPMISNINANATTAKNKRNAQQLASTYGAATAAGATVTGATPLAIAATLKSGVSGPSGSQFQNTKFQVSLGAAEITAAAPYLTFDAATNVLTYDVDYTTP